MSVFLRLRAAYRLPAGKRAGILTQFQTKVNKKRIFLKNPLVAGSDKNTPSSQDDCPPTIGVGKKDTPPTTGVGKKKKIPPPQGWVKRKKSPHRRSGGYI